MVNMGSFLALLSAVFATSKDIVSKKLAADVHGNLSAFASFFFALPFYLIIFLILWTVGVETFTVASGFFTLVLLRAMTDTLAETFKMHALTHGDLSVVSSLISLHPVFILFFSPLITKDPLGHGTILGVLITVLGNIVLLYNPRREVQTKAILFGLLTAVFMSLNNCFDRMSVQSGTPVFSGFMMTLLSGLFLVPLLFRPGVKIGQLYDQRVPFLARGLFEVSFMVSKLTSLTVLTGPEVSAILRISLVFSVLGGKVIFKELHFVRRLIGSVLTVIGVAVVLLRPAWAP